MPEYSAPEARLLAPAQVAELLSISVDEVLALVMSGEIRGMRVGTPPRWRIEEVSVSAYLDDQVEEARRMALWRQSNAASFPELWGGGVVRHSD
ncbi:helix-turn-helix domain-containing protein (plasmid) [Coraliomargarita sp. W4R53]